MNISILFPFIAAIIMTVVLSNVASPSIIQQIKATKIENQIIVVQKALFEAICRYITLEGVYPASIDDLITADYFPASSNNNGFGGVFSFTINSTKGTVDIFTVITDVSARNAFINSYKNTFKPTYVSDDTVLTRFVIPTSVMHGNGQFMTGIPVQSATPSASAYRYWYDTSGTYAILRISDGYSWRNIGTVENTTVGSVLAETSLTGDENVSKNGDIKYIYENATSSVVKYIFYGENWHKAQ